MGAAGRWCFGEAGMIERDGLLRCDTARCGAMFVSVFRAADRGAIEAAARRHGWGCWPGLTVRGVPAPEHLCPGCRAAASEPRVRRGGPCEGQLDLGFGL